MNATMNTTMSTTTRVLMTVVLCTAAVACSKKVKEVPPPMSTGSETTTAPMPETGPTRPGCTGPATWNPMLPAHRVVYFDYDQDALRPEFQAAMACHAKYLRDRPSSRMTLEGNADERGSREYNLGLGERRGKCSVLGIAGQRRLRQPDHGRQLRRGTAHLHCLQRGVLVQEPPRRNRVHGQVRDADDATSHGTFAGSQACVRGGPRGRPGRVRAACQSG